MSNLKAQLDHNPNELTFVFRMRSTDERPLLLVDVVKALHHWNVAMEELDQERNGGPGLLEWRLERMTSRNRTFRITIRGYSATEVQPQKTRSKAPDPTPTEREAFASLERFQKAAAEAQEDAKS